MGLPSLHGLLRKFAFNWRITKYLETLVEAEDSIVVRRTAAMYRIKRNTINLARKHGVVLSRPYAWWNSEPRDIQNPSVEESHFHVLVLGDRKQTTGRFSDLCLVHFLDGEDYVIKALGEMRRMVRKASESEN